MRALLTSFVSVALLGLSLPAVENAAPLGIVYANQEAFFDLVYQNESTGPVQIQQVKAACDCITILTHPATVAAGAVARISCVYRSAIPGAIRTGVEIFGADPARPQASFQVTGFVAEKSWLVSAREVLAGALDQTLLVDVRSAEEFARAHPPRALNLPVFSLKSRAALRSRQLVLFDEGFAPESLLAEVLTLRAQGFNNVAVLTGGLASWVRAGGVMEGTDKSAAQLSVLPAAKFGRSNAINPWLCVEVGEPQKTVKHSIPVLHAANLQDLEKKLAEWPWPVSGGLSFRPVLIVGADAPIQARIESRFGRDQQRQIYYLAGDSDALEAYQAGQVALARHTDQTFVSRPVTSHPVVSGRCGTCGR